MQERDGDMLDRTAGAIRGRCGRVCDVVATEMMNYEPGPYTERVMEAVIVLRDQSKHLVLLSRSPQCKLSRFIIIITIFY